MTSPKILDKTQTFDPSLMYHNQLLDKWFWGLEPTFSANISADNVSILPATWKFWTYKASLGKWVLALCTGTVLLVQCVEIEHYTTGAACYVTVLSK